MKASVKSLSTILGTSSDVILTENMGAVVVASVADVSVVPSVAWSLSNLSVPSSSSVSVNKESRSEDELKKFYILTKLRLGSGIFST